MNRPSSARCGSRWCGCSRWRRCRRRAPPRSPRASPPPPAHGRPAAKEEGQSSVLNASPPPLPLAAAARRRPTSWRAARMKRTSSSVHCDSAAMIGGRAGSASTPGRSWRVQRFAQRVCRRNVVLKRVQRPSNDTANACEALFQPELAGLVHGGPMRVPLPAPLIAMLSATHLITSVHSPNRPLAWPAAQPTKLRDGQRWQAPGHPTPALDWSGRQ